MALLQEQIPSRRVLYCGDTVEFRLFNIPDGCIAFVRTNIGMAKIARRERVEALELSAPVIDRDWHDVVMRKNADGIWSLRIPLVEVGIFSAKCYAQRGAKIFWAEGGNFTVKCEPALNAGANLMYSAFVRQFGPNKNRMYRDASKDTVSSELDKAGYVAIPRSGTFRDLIKELDFIFGRMGFKILQLLPVHPVPMSFGRMGRFGSPFAATDYFEIDPQLAEFDKKVTPMEQFFELVDAVHHRKGRIFMDIPVNHTGWGSRLQSEHPDWFVHDYDGKFVSPGAWGTVWEDLCKLDYSHDVCMKMAEVFLFWCQRGVDGFRCDAGYMLPKYAWDYIVAKVRSQFPDVTFLLEGLGGPLATQEHLLAESGLNWAYSEIFQYYDRGPIEYYYNNLVTGNRENGVLVNYAETHDNTRLAAVSPEWSIQRCILSALLSDCGAFGITNGVEFLAKERVDVHLDCGLNWGAAENIVPLIARLNKLLSVNSCFFASAGWGFVGNSAGESLAVLRSSGDGIKHLLCLMNLNKDHSTHVDWRSTPVHGAVTDLLTGEKLTLPPSGGMTLPAGGMMILSTDENDFAPLENPEFKSLPDVTARQRLRECAGHVWFHFHKFADMSYSADELADKLYKFFPDFIVEMAGSDVGNCIYYYLKEDIRRQVMVFFGGIMAVICENEFSAEVFGADGGMLWSGYSVGVSDGREIAFFYMPEIDSSQPVELTVEFEIFESRRVRHCKGNLLLLSPRQPAKLKMSFARGELLNNDRYALLTNKLSGYSQMASAWGELRSKYDAILAANCNNNVPVDRHVMFTRCRAWLISRDYSFSLDTGSMESWALGFPNAAEWSFSVPVGQGQSVRLVVRVQMADSGNAVKMSFRRPASMSQNTLPDFQLVKIVLRPDLEDRVNHTVTKAFTGSEFHYPGSVKVLESGFEFKPAERRLKIEMSDGKFVWQPEWSYMVPLPREHYYGLEDHTDLFSPGYIEFNLSGGTEAELSAEVSFEDSEAAVWSGKPYFPLELDAYEALKKAVDIFVVKRDSLSTVIAGYPWFLDWGRDTLICLRGLIAAGKLEEVSAIIRKFATFEHQGTIPNMIHGNDVSNRDTSDAPLWLIVGTQNLIEVSGEDSILYRRCGKRQLLEILLNVVKYYQTGTPNGIKMDDGSKLIFSPPHFTWMDTNYPAGTPRQGYPIEIQALWYASLMFLSKYAPELTDIAEQVKASVERYYYIGKVGGFGDCLHCSPEVPASQAVRDNAVRPNQLLAITLGLATVREQQCSILHATERLLIPGAIRSLADAEVEPPMPVYWHGDLLNDPVRPYRGYYRGCEDTARKVSYHNGTAWCWQFPMYAEALYIVGGKKVIPMVRGYLNSAQVLMREAVPWQLPEVADGDYPHRWGGCGAQAWSATEFLRVWTLLRHAIEQEFE